MFEFWSRGGGFGIYTLGATVKVGDGRMSTQLAKFGSEGKSKSLRMKIQETYLTPCFSAYNFVVAVLNPFGES